VHRLKQKSPEHSSGLFLFQLTNTGKINGGP